MIRVVRCLFGVLWALAASVALAQTAAMPSPVTPGHLAEVRAQFARAGIAGGDVAFDSLGRIELRGAYADEREVDRAFSLAQTVVGVRWVSPVTPENIKVKEWERRIGSLFSRAGVLNPPVRGGVPGPVRQRHALVVGVGQFLHGITPLAFATRDAESFYRFLADPNAGRFPRENITYLVNQHATRDNILAALDRIKVVAHPDDLVVVYISSHGSPPDKKGAVNIVAYDSEIKPRERIWHTSITEEALRDFVAGLQAQRLVMVLDTCYSNGAYRSVPGFLPPGGKSLGASDDEGYGVSTESGRRLLGAKDLVIEDSTSASAPKGVRLGESDDAWGRVLIGASGAGERSWESDSLRNSIFTYYFLDGLNRNRGSVQNAFVYAKPLVQQRVKQEKGSDIDQSPQVMATESNWNMRLAPVR